MFDDIPLSPTSSPSILWARGDYSVIGRNLQEVADRLCARIAPGPGQYVLDVATGTGNAAIAAARRGCSVVAVDVSTTLLDAGKKRAEDENLKVEFVEADALALPYPAASYDAVISTFGVMFAPNHELAVREILRVCRPGGRIGLSNWSPDGVFGATGKVVDTFLTRPPEGAPPDAWGSASYLRTIFGSAVQFECRTQRIVYEYPSVDVYLDTLIHSYPPTINTFAKLPANQRPILRDRLRKVYESWNLSSGDGFRMPMDYLEAVGEKMG